MRSKTLILSILISCSVLAQKLDYGLGINFNAPLVNKDKNGFSSNGGYGLGLNFSYPLGASQWSLSNRYQLNRLSYFSPNLNANINADQFQFYLGMSYAVRAMDSTLFSFHYVLSYANSNAHFQGTGTQKRKIALNPFMDNPVDLGLQFSTEIKISKYTGIELSYTYFVFAEPAEDFFDAQPNVIRLAINLHFNRDKAVITAKKKMKASLDSLSRDTLIVINKACSDKMSNELLTELFNANYSYSAFKVISVEQLDSVRANSKPLFFAIVGEFYAGLGEPESSGIYLLDRNFNLTEFPYPVHTMYLEALNESECFSSIATSSWVIKTFSNRLRNSQ